MFSGVIVRPLCFGKSSTYVTDTITIILAHLNYVEETTDLMAMRRSRRLSDSAFGAPSFCRSGV